MSAPTVPATPAIWSPQVFAPYPFAAQLLFGRVAARSPMFGASASAGGDHVLIGSSAGTDADDVALRSRGELLERLGNVLAGRAAESRAALVADHTELLRRGAPALDPSPWTGPDGRRARQLWVSGRSLLHDTEVLVPAGLVFLQHRTPTGCAAALRTGSTGLAAHPERSAAIGHAAWETLERDLLRRSWQSPAKLPPAVRAVHDELPPVVRRVCEEFGLAATALTVSVPGADAVAVCLHTPGRRQQTFGARCGPPGRRHELLARAAHEALMVRWSMHTPAAHRACERLAATGTPVSAVEHALWTYQGKQDALAHWTCGSPRGRGAAPPGSEETAHGGADAASGNAGVAAGPADPVRVLAEHTGQDVIAVDTTPLALHDEGTTVLRVVAPGALPLPSTSRPGTPPHPFG
ncbi:YcaO-like family protein [Streptomyces ochraceiscleroticus]|uniref:YcaO-like family protein n=1 Tax=Streptomyces ochraceiscleroticus TaxID=47761 RepID=A0ABW1MKK9_9ACTN|nr:YcaO-like family protein [Streptomyces ochraceiscleroticus]